MYGLIGKVTVVPGQRDAFAATITARQPLPLCMISLAGLGLTSGSRIDDTLVGLPSRSA